MSVRVRVDATLIARLLTDTDTEATETRPHVSRARAHAHAHAHSHSQGPLDAKGVRLIGIAGEHLGREEFVEKYWKGELFFDMGKTSWFPAVHGGKKYSNTASGIFSALFGGKVAKAWKRMTSKGGIEGNLKGEGFTLGGVWVVHP